MTAKSKIYVDNPDRLHVLLVKHLHTTCTAFYYVQTSFTVPSSYFPSLPPVGHKVAVYIDIWHHLVSVVGESGTNLSAAAGEAVAWTMSLRQPRAYGLLERLPHHCSC